MKILQHSSWYEAKIKEVQEEKVNLKLAGLKSSDDGNSKIEFDKRLEALQKLENYLQSDYNEALIQEGKVDANDMWYIPRQDYGY